MEMLGAVKFGAGAESFCHARAVDGEIVGEVFV